jgi:hypothetical protein
MGGEPSAPRALARSTRPERARPAGLYRLDFRTGLMRRKSATGAMARVHCKCLDLYVAFLAGFAKQIHEDHKGHHNDGSEIQQRSVA